MAELTGHAGVFPGGTSNVYSTSPLPITVGTRAKDVAGNEYVFVKFTATTYYGCLVQINSIYNAAPLLGTANRAFRVGVVCSGTASSVAGEHPVNGDYGWVQIYGVHSAVQTGMASDGGVSATAGGAYFCIPQTSVGTPTGVLSLIAQAVGVSVINTSTEGNLIYGMWVVDFAEVTDLTTWPGSSGASGPTSRNTKDATSGAATSAFIGQTYAVHLNYPYVTGISVPLSDADSDT